MPGIMLFYVAKKDFADVIMVTDELTLSLTKRDNLSGLNLIT